MVEFAEPPSTTVAEEGDAEREKPGVDEIPPASALISPVVFGLPQPVAKS